MERVPKASCSFSVVFGIIHLSWVQVRDRRSGIGNREIAWQSYHLFTALTL